MKLKLEEERKRKAEERQKEKERKKEEQRIMKEIIQVIIESLFSDLLTPYLVVGSFNDFMSLGIIMPKELHAFSGNKKLSIGDRS